MSEHSFAGVGTPFPCFVCLAALLDAGIPGPGLQLQGQEAGRMTKPETVTMSLTFLSQFLGAWWDRVYLHPLCLIGINSEFCYIACGKNSSLVVHLCGLTLCDKE